MLKKYISIFEYSKLGYNKAKCGIITEVEAKEEATKKAQKYMDKSKVKHGIKEYKHIKTILKSSFKTSSIYCVISI